LGLNSILLPRLGPIGAVVSLAATFTPLVAFYFVTLARRLGAGLRAAAVDLARAAAAAAAMAGAIAAARAAPARPPAPAAVALAALVLLGAATYGGALHALGGLRRRGA